MKRLFCFGLGFTGLTLAKRLKASGWSVAGTHRTKDKVAFLRSSGIDGFVFSGKEMVPDIKKALAKASHVVSTIAPDGPSAGDGTGNWIADPVLRYYKEDLLNRAQNLAWVGYISSTNVYGDHDGQWVDETTTPRPGSERAGQRLDIEHAWQDMCQTDGVPVHILRPAGIYGPYRSALTSLKNGTARRVIRPGQWISRIHVSDLAAVVIASAENQNPGSIYNVADDEPSPRATPTEFAAMLLQQEPPPAIPFEEWQAPQKAKRDFTTNKRIRNDRIKRDLGIVLTYPSYRDGLKALFEAGEY